MFTTTPPTYTLTLLGDVMLGRLVDQLLPDSVPSADDAAHISNFRRQYPSLQSYTYASPSGNVLPLFRSSSLVLANLETSATLHPTPYPDKTFNYRTHPSNLHSLTTANIAHVSLANNHTLDFCETGLLDTIAALRHQGISFAGAGSTPEEAARPAVLTLPSTDPDRQAHEIHCYSFSDHPASWSSIPLFNHIDYTSASRARLKSQLTAPRPDGHRPPALKLVSMHWGPNYAWQPAPEIRLLARFLVRECGVDIVHGHSSHHIQGVEIIERSEDLKAEDDDVPGEGESDRHATREAGSKGLVIYGCGDFVDDYAVNGVFRNDLSAAWRVTVGSAGGSSDGDVQKDAGRGLEVQKLEVFPNRIKTFQASLLRREDPDHEWVMKKFRQLCKEMGTDVQEGLGSEGQIVVVM
ncbi:uncharacterized protein HMPREF1541_10158 [Cyphellophora europaea CBS 101466]|uniref:Capsule synthesis protein CapA domain-containing protein n=1 Tax=Cyphellophora europaea (strain CBS 101466) TaxID=1220924 RepID=W2S8Z0_CYPE1|nr:uncharacterized protein HMPREF1541_10158 [Cyphellophora europaea CBS 101466]ETN44488.1 hypothetical protein HMPREF1541_10158 [Cyphellophora europaea CBS 101466]